MAIPTNVVKHVISGTLPGNEIFQTSFWIKSPSAPAVTDASETALAASTSMQALFTAMQALMGGGSQITALDGYGYTGGSGATSHGHAAVAKVGTGTVTHPNQCAIVVTLRSATASRSGRGRMYFPYTGGAVTPGTGLGDITAIGALIDACATAIGPSTGSAFPVVVSQTLSQAFPIISADGDYVIDTQRRRRNKMLSARHSHTV